MSLLEIYWVNGGWWWHLSLYAQRYKNVLLSEMNIS